MLNRLPVLALTVLVALVAPMAPVSATPTAVPYIKAPATVERGERATIRVKVSTDGNGLPEGRVTLVVVRAKGGFKWKDDKQYRGKPVAFRTPVLEKRGRYVVKARFDPKSDSWGDDSHNRARFRVVRRG